MSTLPFERLTAGSPTTRLAAAAGILWLALAVGVAILLMRERESTIERASRNLGALALALESHTARTFQAVDLTLAGAVDALRLADDLPPHDPEFQAALERRAEFLAPYVRAIYIVDADGRVVHDTDYPRPVPITPAAHSYFREHRDKPWLVGMIAPPIANDPGLGWFVPVTRRLGREGRFEGIALAAVQPRYFETLYRRMGLGLTDVISLYYEDGQLISRYPDMGASPADAALFAEYLPESPAGTYVAEGPDGSSQLFSYRDVEAQPLVVTVAQDMRTVLAPWRAVVTGAAIAQGALLLLLALLVDQFRRQQRVRERAYAQHARTERLQALGHLTSGIAHDFNNLLSVIASSLAIVDHGESDGAAHRDALAAAKRAVDRGAELIRRLATFARSRPIEPARCSLNDCVRNCEELLKRAAGNGVDLLIDLAPDLPPCRLDETELEMALVNLVVNARDALAGTGHIAVRTYASEEGERVCVAVEDTGHGMPESVQHHAFEPYYTTKGDKGTGLGLAQVYGFMLQLGGEARLESSPGFGTRVELRFPVAGPED